MKPKTCLLCTKHDWNAFIELPCGAIFFRQCKLRSRVGFCYCLNRSRHVGGRHPGGSGGVKNEPWISRTPLCPMNSTGVRTPPVQRHTGNIHVARVMIRWIFGLTRQRLDKLSFRAVLGQKRLFGAQNVQSWEGTSLFGATGLGRHR